MGTLQELQAHRSYCRTRMEQLTEDHRLGIITSRNELRRQYDRYYADLQDTDRRIIELQGSGVVVRSSNYTFDGINYVPDDPPVVISAGAPLSATPYGDRVLPAYDPTPAFVYNGKPLAERVEEDPAVRYRKLVLANEKLIIEMGNYHKQGRAVPSELDEAIYENDGEIDKLRDELGYQKLVWECWWTDSTPPQIRYKEPPPPPREIIDKLFTEITGLNPEDTYDGWREAFINTGLVSALEHMKEHVR